MGQRGVCWLSGALEVDKAELKVLATPFYFKAASGKIEAPTGIVITCDAGDIGGE
jgi:hypothetical protein